jgi:PEP-CTERM motif-containing protein
MYWADVMGGDLRRANLDGTGQMPLVTGQFFPRGPTLDLAGGKMYWTSLVSGDGGNIELANMDGTGQMTLLTGMHPIYIALQFEAGPVPEPATLLLLAIGTVGVIGWAWRRRRPTGHKVRRSVC